MKYLLITLLFLSVNFSFAQTINWSSQNDNSKRVAYLNFGYDFGITSQIGYGIVLNTKRSIILSADYSTPMGKNIADDFKIRLGGQLSLFAINNFIFSAKAYGLFRRHQTNLIRMAGFGSEVAGIIGYYKLGWHVAGELGFDKSIVTHLKHTEEMQQYYPEISNAWFMPSGGHFYYGFQGSRTIRKKVGISFRAGVTNAEFNDENALLPYYAQLGLNYKFGYAK